MTSEKDLNDMVRPDEPSTSGILTTPDDNANLKDDTTTTNNHKGAIPKVIKTKTKLSFTKKSTKLNNNIDEGLKNDTTKLNGMSNGTSSFIVEKQYNHYNIPSENCTRFNDDSIEEEESRCMTDDLLVNMKNVHVINEPLDFRENTSKYDDSSDDDDDEDDDLFSVSDDGCIYTYKGDQVADLPSTFFNLNNLLPLQIPPPEENNIERNSSPEMDFLEMDFDPGPSESSEIIIENHEGNEENNCGNQVKASQHIITQEQSASYPNSYKDDTDPEINKITLNEPTKRDCSKKCNRDVSVVLPISKTLKVASIESDHAYHKLYPWLCPISERTTASKEQTLGKRCHSTRGELISPSERVPTLKLIRKWSNASEEAMIWNESEAYSNQVNQIGPSACGATAVLNVLNALRFPIPSLDELNQCVNTKLRSNTSPLTEYLLSRSVAGTDHNDIIDGLKKLSKNQIYARFFHMYPERIVNLQKWLTFWIKNGAVPIATLNLQKCRGRVPDAWHHQMIYGVGSKGIYLTNPYECIEPEELWPQLCSESVLLIRREDILKRWDIKIDLGQLMKIQDQRWRNLNVVGTCYRYFEWRTSSPLRTIKIEYY